MNQIEKNKSKTDQAWAQLYTRLEQDGLLDKPISGTQIPYRIGLMKWAAAIIILCVSVATAIFQINDRPVFLGHDFGRRVYRLSGR